jgi:hypothetical protein
MIVVTVHQVTAAWLEENRIPMMQSQALLDSEAWHVFCAEREDGTGLVNYLYMHKDDAEHFEVGKQIKYHYKRDEIPGFGQLAFIEREPKQPALKL